MKIRKQKRESAVSDIFLNIPRTRLFKNSSEFFLKMICYYFRVEVKGIQQIPRNGPGVIIANHSGFVGADAVVLAYLIRFYTGRKPRIMAHRGYFEWMNWLREWSYKVGLREACIPRALRTLRHGHLLIVFPEGEAGNFKSSLKRYQLQDFHTGFIRLALESHSKVIPTVIMGAEESNLNLGSLNLSQIIKGLRIPFPLNFIPLPAKWSIEFLDPINVSSVLPPDQRSEKEIKLLSEQIQTQVQRAIALRLKNRKFFYSPGNRKSSPRTRNGTGRTAA